MIRSFADAEAERVWHQQRPRRLPAEIQQRALNKLAMLSDATDLNFLRVSPGNRLEALSGERAGQHNIRINRQWRICFRGTKGDAHEVEIVGYR